MISISFTGKGKEGLHQCQSAYKTVLKKERVAPDQYEEAKKSRAYRS